MNAAIPLPNLWLAFARRVLYAALHGADPVDIPPPLDAARPFGGVFTTLYKLDTLRGCMGVLDTESELAEAVCAATVQAALRDPRFAPLSAAELPEVWIEVSVLSPPWPLRRVEELELGQHGIIVRRDGRRGLFLPQVAEKHGLDREAFLTYCCREKAGLPPDAWRDPATEVLLFTTEVWTERPTMF